MKEKIAVYGGAFDPITIGHLHIIEKASKMFDKVIVVIAENPNKKTMFSLGTRCDMLSDAIHNMPNVTGRILPSHQYLVNFAESIGANFLVRGIRDTIDFTYEQNLYRTNRKISSKVETVYLMPDDNFSLVSSSWVKGLLSINGWRDVVRPHVTPFVMNNLIVGYLETFVRTVCKEISEMYNVSMYDDEIVELVMLNYGKNAYHNYDHLLDGIEAMKEYGTYDNTIGYAWIMHDIAPTEEESIAIANSFLIVPIPEVDMLIRATKHDTCEYDTSEEELIASIDLLILASSPKKYNEYIVKIFGEYFKKSKMRSRDKFKPLWIKGRTEFLEKMLSRKRIYTYLPFRKETVDGGYDSLERDARQNMNNELKELKNEKR